MSNQLTPATFSSMQNDNREVLSKIIHSMYEVDKWTLSTIDIRTWSRGWKNKLVIYRDFQNIRVIYRPSSPFKLRVGGLSIKLSPGLFLKALRLYYRRAAVARREDKQRTIDAAFARQILYEDLKQTLLKNINKEL